MKKIFVSVQDFLDNGGILKEGRGLHHYQRPDRIGKYISHADNRVLVLMNDGGTMNLLNDTIRVECPCVVQYI